MGGGLRKLLFVCFTIALVAACSRPELPTVVLFERYLAASNAHDLQALEVMTADDVVWRLGPWTFEGKGEALRPHYADLINHTVLEAHHVVARGDTIECTLIERNDATRAHGPDSLVHYARYVFRAGLVETKEPWAPSESMVELNRRAAPFRKWVREEHPEALAVILDSTGTPSWTRDAAEMTHRMRDLWVSKGRPGS